MHPSTLAFQIWIDDEGYQQTQSLCLNLLQLSQSLATVRACQHTLTIKEPRTLHIVSSSTSKTLTTNSEQAIVIFSNSPTGSMHKPGKETLDKIHFSFWNIPDILAYSSIYSFL
jgi:hypothetical protein